MVSSLQNDQSFNYDKVIGSTNKKILDLDVSLCLKVNRLSGRKTVDKIFYPVSRLGDGSIYFCNLNTIHYLSAVCVNMLFFKLIKRKAKRGQPFNPVEVITHIISTTVMSLVFLYSILEEQ